MIDEQDCVDAIKKAADTLGHSPSRPEYSSLDISPHHATISKKCGSWNEAKKKAGLETVGPGGTCDINHTYFDSIDTEEKAYWLGFLYGDGSIYQNTGSVEVQLAVQSSDGNVIESFKDALNSEHSIVKSNGKCSIAFRTPSLTSALQSHGLTLDKTTSGSLPDISRSSLQSAFTRGLFDADGHTGDFGRFNITGSSRERFEKLSEWLPVDTSIHDRTDGVFVIRVGSKPRLNELNSWLYPDGAETQPALQRKIPDEL
jgi:hypothetical protein